MAALRRRRQCIQTVLSRVASTHVPPMLPFISTPAWHLGPITIQAFGVTVGLALGLGLTRFERRISERGLDTEVARRFTTWVIAGGILGAHLFSVLAYFPDKLRSDPWLLFRLWEDISSFGGMLGGMLAAALFFAVRERGVAPAARLAYLDALAFVFPVSLAIGRFGCALAHDHPGRLAASPLAISLATPQAQSFATDAMALPSSDVASAAAAGMGFFDLGLLECLFLTAVIVPLFVVWNRVPRRNGFFLFAFPALYLPMRFALDMLRVADVRYAGLTPAQWVAAAVVPTLPFFVLQRRSLRYAAGAALLLLSGWACTTAAR